MLEYKRHPSSPHIFVPFSSQPPCLDAPTLPSHVISVSVSQPLHTLCVHSLRSNRIKAAGERALAFTLRHYNRSLVALDLRANMRPAAGVALTEAALAPG
jgi:hypothetical protein